MRIPAARSVSLHAWGRSPRPAGGPPAPDTPFGGRAIHLFTADRTEKRVPRASVEAIQQSRVSVMPQGLKAQLSRQELGDLIAFLQSLK